MEGCYNWWERNKWDIVEYQGVWGPLLCLCDIVFVWVVKFNLQLHTPSGSLEQVWSELLRSCPSCSDSAIVPLLQHACWAVQQVDPFKKESPQPNRIGFQLVGLPEIVFCISLPGVCGGARYVWYSRCLTRECGAAGFMFA